MKRGGNRKTVIGLALTTVLFAACRFDPAYRDFPDLSTLPCIEGIVECRGSALTRCDQGKFAVIDDCGGRGEACATVLKKCTPCAPGELTCDGQSTLRCSDDGQTRNVSGTCDASQGFACRSGVCSDLCGDAAEHRSNIGCEYWPVDLDNAVLPPEGGLPGNAAIQQYAVIVTNPQPDIAAVVTVEEDTAAPGQPNAPHVVATATVGPNHLEVFKLGPREVDGSPPDVPNGGTGTALTRHAYRLRSTVPIIAYQFNPLENFNVRSNDATVLLPTSALVGSTAKYVVAGWPQTIARTEDPHTNFNEMLRVFLAVVGTTPDTHVKIHTTARVIPGGPFPNGAPKNTEVEATLQPFEVLNLETGDFLADFTGSTVEADQAVVVYVGSEASDAPFFTDLSQRSCCADHLEVQVTPTRAVGQHYTIGRMPNRSQAVSAAGAVIGTFKEPELYRVVATADGPTHVTTSLPAPYDAFDLAGPGADLVLSALEDFRLDASQPVLVADVQVSQEAAGISIANGLPGGDPSLLLIPATEQWRNDYVLLTPDKYAFDFLVITAPNGAHVFVDGLAADGTVCEITTAAFTVYRCQLSFPIIDPAGRPPTNILPGVQHDGVHRVQADVPVGVLVYGFDYRVSYAYAGGTELVDIAPK
jgi:hypothetical protein